MNLQFTQQILPFAAAALVLALLLHVAWINRRDPVARWFAATLLGMIVWAVAYCFEIMATGLEGMVLFANIQFLGVATVSLSWWEMTRRYLNLRRVPKALTLVLWTVAAVTIVLAFANPAGLFRGTPSVITGAAPFPVLDPDYGPWYWWVYLPETALLNLAVLALLAKSMVRSHRLLRSQCALLLGASLLPLATTVIYVTGIPPLEHYNLTAAVSGVSGLLLWLGLFRWRLFNIIPLAHDRVVENLADGVLVVDRAGRIIDLNRSAEIMTGLESRTATGRHAAELLAAYPVLLELVSVPCCDSLPGATARDMTITRGGISSYYSVSSSPVNSKRGAPLGTAVIMHDITERVRLFEQTRALANKDDLTALPNRRHFFELTSRELDRARRYQKPVSLLMFDVDHFKSINDTYGHRAGDEVLRDLARVCRNTLRSSDVIGRVGGEEFAVLLPETDLDVAVEVAERLRQAVQTVRIPPHDEQRAVVPPAAVTVSLGVAQLETDRAGISETLDSVFERADRALYRAKETGRNTVVVSSEAPRLRAAV